jgi:hypothetical protein
MKHLILISTLLVLSACATPQANTQAAPQTGITISGTASMGIARDGN